MNPGATTELGLELPQLTVKDHVPLYSAKLENRRKGEHLGATVSDAVLEELHEYVHMRTPCTVTANVKTESASSTHYMIQK